MITFIIMTIPAIIIFSILTIIFQHNYYGGSKIVWYLKYKLLHKDTLLMDNKGNRFFYSITNKEKE